MTTKLPIPALSIDDLERFAPAGVVASMDAPTLGAFVRLLSHAWKQEPPCSLPADDALLAVIARTPARSDWDRVKPVILLAFTPDQLPGGTRLVNAVARGIFDQLAAEAASASERNSRNAAARWQARHREKDPPGDASRMRLASDSHATGIRPASAPSVRSESLRSELAPALPRSFHESKSERSEGAGAQDVVASLSERARAQADQRLADWKVEQSRSILEKALSGWIAAGATSFPISRVSELARGPHSSPDRVQSVTEDASARLASAKASGQSFNVIGWVIKGLGLNRNGHVRPAAVPMQVSLEWQRREAVRADELIKTTSLQAAMDNIRRSRGLDVSSRVGGAGHA